jgi:hypothetical protein
MQQRPFSMALLRGLFGLVVGLLTTFLASLIWPTPWTLNQAFVAIGVASFFAAFSAARSRMERV